jgi:uncharacterized protein YjhX (UPF0386 family)
MSSGIVAKAKRIEKNESKKVTGIERHTREGLCFG